MGGVGARPHGRSRVCDQQKEHTFFSLANLLGDWRSGRLDLWNSLEVPPSDREVLILGMWEMVCRVPTSRVAHPFGVKHGAGLACWLDQRRRELDARKARLPGDDPYRSYVPEEAPPPINVIVVVGHGF